MGTREHVSCFVSPMSLDYTQEDRVAVSIVGPRGGGQFYGVMTPMQARTLRDNLDLALTRINDVHARAENEAYAASLAGPGSVDHMPERNSDDAVDGNGCPKW